ncbi:MAG: phenylacetate--CoA ligase family protein [Phycisphaerae bacterium]|nr:phenylacetate--CoA ligase family protein [Phycisphaerae bacterium]
MIYSIADLVARRSSAEATARLYRSTPEWLQQGLALHRFRQTVRHAATHSPFYRRKFAEHKIDPASVRTPADLKDLYTTPDDICACAEDFLCEPPTMVYESSGTSGTNKRVYYSESDLVGVGVAVAAGLRLMGIEPGDRVVNAFDFSIWIPGILCHYGLVRSGAFFQDFGKCDPIEVWRRLERYQYNVVLGEPTWLIRLTEIAERNGGGKLKLLVGGAEEMPADAYKWISKVWGGAKVKMCYSGVENASGLGFQPCDAFDGYHTDNTNFLTEIVDRDSNGFGEIVFTTLSRRQMPLIRYRTRDVARFIDGKCSCGITAPRISRIHGRRDELVVASGGNLYPRMFDNILRNVPGLTLDWQVIFKLEGVREILEINVESTRPDAEQIEAEVHRYATDLYPDLMKNLALGIFEMRVRVHPPGTVRTGRKLRRLLDRRHFELPENEDAAEAQSPAPVESTV